MLTGARVPKPSARGDYRSHRNMVASNLVYRGVPRGLVKSKQ